MATSRIEVEGSSSSTILRMSVGSTEIGSSWGAADEGLVDAELNAWDNSSTPRTDWDAMIDNCEDRGSEIEYRFEEKMNYLPEQLMISIYGVFSQ